MLRLLDDAARAQIANLEIEEVEAAGLDIALQQDFDAADRSDVSTVNLRHLSHDLAEALEGETVERRTKLTRRAAWIADRFVRERQKNGSLRCDDCSFDPQARNDIAGVKPRSCFDVHHRNPLAEGKRLTSLDDLSLLCPTCHRIEHAKLRILKMSAKTNRTQ